MNRNIHQHQYIPTLKQAVSTLALAFAILLGDIPTVLGQTAKALHGEVRSAVDGKGIAGASLKVKGTAYMALSDAQGRFRLYLPAERGKIEVSHVGYRTLELDFGSRDTTVHIRLTPVQNLLEDVEVLSTGYYQVPRERATGSFDYIGREELGRFPATNLLDRLDGVVNGLTMDRSHYNGEDGGEPKLRLRGLSTIESNSEPLVILDGFAYEDDLALISPSDIESITVLKDAAAASIWGARAGNGVLVITTKKGKQGQPTKVSYSTQLQVQAKPDLFYSPDYLPSATVLDIEDEMFVLSNYRERDQTAIPLYTEWLIKHRDGLIGDDELAEVRATFAATDTRRESLRHFYRKGLNQHHDLSISGGGDTYSFRSGVAYDRNRDFMIGNGYRRWNANMSGTMQLNSRLTVSPAIWYTRQQQWDNAIGYSTFMDGGNSVVPYYRFMDGEGRALPIVHRLRYAYQEKATETGLLDWMYRPLDERNKTDSQGANRDVRLQLSTNYALFDQVRWEVFYQFMSGHSESPTLYDKDSYYVRDLVNRLTQTDEERIVPYGGIMRRAFTADRRSHTLRTQVQGSWHWGNDHSLHGLAGGELNDRVTRGTPLAIAYDFDPILLTGRANFDYVTRYAARPSGTMQVPSSNGSYSATTSRFLSYYSNASYTFREKYIWSGSLRWDASNIYGVKTNQKGVPLWSMGLAWHLGRERFAEGTPFSGWKLRATYGSAGNTNPSVSTYPVISYSVDDLTNYRYANLSSVGNPSLRWEQIGTLNMGVDYTLLKGRITGALEYYRKYAKDLIGVDLMDPTTGIIDEALPLVVNRINYADMKTQGWDITVNSRNLTGAFSWDSRVQAAYVRNRVTHYMTNELTTTSLFISQTPPVKGESLDVIFAMPWNGLNDQGKPIIYDRDGELTDDYPGYYKDYAIEDLVNVGTRIPLLTGNMVNTFRWKAIYATLNLSWKSGYSFKRTTMTTRGEVNGNYHRDYYRRWAAPGDELHTDVLPKVEVSTPETTAITSIYSGSEVLWEEGDHLRWRDIGLGYVWNNNGRKSLPRQVRFGVSWANLGIIWRKNGYGLDPDSPNASYPRPRITSFSLSAEF